MGCKEFEVCEKLHERGAGVLVVRRVSAVDTLLCPAPGVDGLSVIALRRGWMNSALSFGAVSGCKLDQSYRFGCPIVLCLGYCEVSPARHNLITRH